MLTNEELLKVRGGAISPTLLNAVARIINTVYEIGEVIGSSIRRVVTKKTCKVS